MTTALIAEQRGAALRWLYDRLTVDGGMGPKEQITAANEIAKVLRGQPSTASTYKANEWAESERLETGSDALEKAAPGGPLVHAAREIVAHRMSTFRAGNGKQVGVEADDGEKCWIVHSDQMFALESALNAPSSPAPDTAGLIERATKLIPVLRDSQWSMVHVTGECGSNEPNVAANVIRDLLAALRPRSESDAMGLRDFYVGQPVEISESCPHKDWRRMPLWIRAFGVNSDGKPDIAVSEHWPPRDNGDWTDGFKPEDLQPRAMIAAAQGER